MTGSTKSTGANRLAHATSPYLLQHAHNPVDWFEWGPEALKKAQDEDKPILVSIGYSSCHWCHVMERESFENMDIAAIMNEHFVCIKVDREERPDIDQIYMEAVQALGVNGGWPLNVFLTPGKHPFFGGTYFPPGNWSRLLIQIAKVFKEKRPDIDKSADQLLDHLNTSDLKRFAGEELPIDANGLQTIFQSLEKKYDPVWGGFDKAPKFIMPSAWRWLLHYHMATRNKKALEMVTHTLRQLAMGGIYDQVGGGFARYSVDHEWFAPHFEKMLYDNAQLLSLYSEAYRVSGDDVFKKIVYETVGWLKREMMVDNSAFCSAIDADSEGVEGKFYTWTYAELEEVLERQAGDVARHFQSNPEGNWEHGRNILRLNESGLSSEAIAKMAEPRQKLLEARNKRIRPGLDDKVLMGWNAMMVSGLVDCHNAFGDDEFIRMALDCMGFLEANLVEGTKCYRSYRKKRGPAEGFLEDYAFLISAYVSLYQSTFDESWISKAKTMAQYVIENFLDRSEGHFYFTSSNAEKLIARKKEIFDNVIPSSNSVMARNLFHLGTLLDIPDWKGMAEKMTTSLRSVILSEPSYASNWAMLASELAGPFAEIAIVGSSALSMRSELMRKKLFSGVMLGTQSTSSLPLLADKPPAHETKIFVCYNKACLRPVNSVDEALSLLESIK